MTTAGGLDGGAAERDQARAVAWAAAGRSLTSQVLTALVGGPTWTPPALAAIDGGDAVLTGAGATLVRREGRGAEQVIEVDPRALQPLRDELDGRKLDVLALAQEIGQRLSSVDELPKVLGRWRDLALGLALGPYAQADKLLADVGDACDRDTPGRALDLLEAADALARLIGGPLAAAARIGRHRVDYEQRIADDRSQLETYVPRADAQAAFERLMADTGPWALHYLGVGGVGKTTFLRHVTVVEAEERKLSVARIDFDYLGPSYPGRDPGRLVEAIVDDLKARISQSVQDRWLRTIAEQVARVRTLAGERAGGDPDWVATSRELDELLSVVGSFLQSLGRPLLIFDTCEELMKLAPVGRTIPSVEATFRLIEELHERCPALRVIFAGRRLLAEGGAGWHAPPSLVTRVVSAARPYLALYELRGFSAAEAEEALAKRLPVSRRGDLALIDAILEASPEDERAAPVERPEPAVDHHEAPRYSPFRITALGGWVTAEPDVLVGMIEGGGGDPYIEHRIVRRMGRLEPLLPVVALLRRFDLETLAAVLGSRAEATDAFEALADHEWIEPTFVGQRGVLLVAKRSVVEPLEAYLATARAQAWDDARRAVAAALAPRLVGNEAVRQPHDVVDAALRALTAAEAVRTWQELEDRVGPDWPIALALTKALMGEGAAAAPALTLLGAAVRATHASALIHDRRSDAEVAELWGDVEQGALAVLAGDSSTDDPAAAWTSHHDGEAPAAWLLHQRARLGRAAAHAWSDQAKLGDQVDEVADVVERLARWNRLDALACPVIAAVEAVVERAEREGGSVGERLFELQGRLPAPTTGAAAFVAMLKVRLQTLAGELVEARPERRLAWRIVQQPGKDALPPTTVDWLPPTSLRARLRLEALRLGFFEPSSAADEAKEAEPGGLLAPPPDGEHDVDSEHLRAAIGLHAEAHRRAPVGPLPTTSSAGVRPYASYARFPIEGYAIGLYRDGRLPRGHRERLSYRGVSGAVTARVMLSLDPDAVDDRMVTGSEPTGPADLRRRLSALGRALEVAYLSPTVTDGLGAAHVDLIEAWPRQVIATREQLEEVIAAVRGRISDLEARARSGPLQVRMRAAAILDELLELSRYTREPLVAALPGLPDLGKEVVHADHVEDVAALALRAWAAGRFVYPPPASKPTALSTWLAEVARATPRRFAQLAHDEGQLLALRLPDRGLRLLEQAAASYLACDDRVGATAAHLAADVARCRLGQPPVGEWRELLATLEPAEEALLTPLADRVTTRMPRRGPARLPPTEGFLATFERGKRRRPSRRKRVVSWWQRNRSDVFVWAAVVAVILAIGGAGWAFVAYGKEWIADGLRRLGVPHAETSVTGGAALAVLYVLLHLNRPLEWFRDWRRNVRVRKLVVTGQVRRTSEDEVALTLEAVDGLPPDVRARLPRAGRHPTLIGGAAPGDLPPALATLIDRCASIYPGPAGVPLVLVIEPGLVAHAWESMLLGAHHLLAEVFAPLRVIAVPRPPKLAKVEGTLHASVAIRAHVGNGLAEPGVIHAIGRPVRRAHSIGLDVGDEDAAAPLSPAELAPVGARLVVLQGAPQAATEVPTDAFRTEVGLLRELGAALIAHGVAEVLIVPPVPLATMASLQEVLAEPHTLDRAIGYRSDKTALAHAARAHLRTIGDSFHRAAALEVTLMVATVPATGTSFGSIVSR